MYFVLTVLHIPVMRIYHRYGNFQEESGLKLPLRVSLGSMGYANAKCRSSGMAA
jgi:hypothetical protein